jgi:hypothetical protein
MSTNVNSGSGSGGTVTTGGVQLGTAAPKGLRQRISQMIAGIQAAIPDGSSVTVGGVAMAKADLVNELSQISAAYQAIDAGVLAAKGARSQLKSGLSGFQKTYLGIKDAMAAYLGRGNPQLAQLGIKVSEGSKPLTPAQKVVKAEKAKKTRALRHTMGKVQKAAVQYTGDLEVAVNETAPAAPANDTAPAAAPPAAAEAQNTPVASVQAATPAPVSHTE